MKPNFVECMTALQLEYLKYHRLEKNNITPNYNTDFWYVVDNLDDKIIHEYTEKLLKLKKVEGKPYLKICNINHDYKQYKHYTVKQKRYLAMTLITHWDELTLHFLY